MRRFITKAIGRVGVTAFMLLMMSLGITGVWAVTTPITQYVMSLGWPQAEGEILRSGVQRIDTDDDYTTYHAWAEYRYTVNGEVYTGERLLFGYNWDGSLRRTAQQLVDRYPPEQAIMVFYDPSNPDISVVERRVGVGPLLALPLVLIFAAGTVVLPFVILVKRLVGMVRQQPPRTKTPLHKQG